MLRLQQLLWFIPLLMLIEMPAANGMYDPHLGRFCSRDPIGYKAGHNLFASSFAIAKTDPLGLCQCSVSVTAKIFAYTYAVPSDPDSPLNWEPDTPASVGPEKAGFVPGNAKSTCKLSVSSSVQVSVGYDTVANGSALGVLKKKVDFDIDATCYKKPCPCRGIMMNGAMTSLRFWFKDGLDNWGGGYGATTHGHLVAPVPASFSARSVYGPPPPPSFADCKQTINVALTKGLPFVYGLTTNLSIDLYVW